MKPAFSLFLAAVLSLGFWACSDDHQHTPSEKEKAHKVANIAWRDLSHQDTVQLGDTVTYEYVFFNTGWKPVYLKTAEARMGNVTFQLPQGDTPVGEQDTLRVTSVFDTPGQQSLYFDVTHNTPQKPFLLSLLVWVEAGGE